MRNTFMYGLAIASMILLGSCGDKDSDGGNNTKQPETLPAQMPEKTNTMNVYAHYMPWFNTPETNNGRWGYHWTMNNQDPNVIEANGQRQIASHYYPLTGPYDSTDPAVLDYQCLLMKYSGIDGVMIDWYGTQDKNDYPANRINTEAMVKAIEKAGLKFSIVYEDATLSNASDMVTQARLDITYLATGFFKSPNYTKVNARPLLLDFGPQTMTAPQDWYRAFSILGTQPYFISLNDHIQNANNAEYTTSQGEYVWVNPNPDYTKAAKFEFYIGGAMPGFNDFYAEGGAGTGYTSYDSEGGALFQRQLDAAKSANLEWLQISTWNDYGEGTNIEPTVEYGYQYLTALQKYTGVSYNQQDLELIFRWYKVCVAHRGDPKVEQAYNYLNALQPDKAAPIITELEK